MSWLAKGRLGQAGGSGGVPTPQAEVTFQSQPAALFMSRWSGLKPNPTAPVPSAEPRARQEGREGWPTEDAVHHCPPRGAITGQGR